MKKLIMLCLLSFFFLYGSAFGSFNFIDNGDGTVTDARTGLVWLKDVNCYGGQTWVVATSYAAVLNSGECGLSDGSIAGAWRLPTKEELQKIGTDPPTTWLSGYPTVPWTRPVEPFVNVQTSIWSSTPHSEGATYIYMPTGEVSGQYTDHYYYKYGVWPVRGYIPITTTTTTAATSTRFNDNNNGTVTDARTGLVWLKNANPCGLKSWYDAQPYLENLSNGQEGLTDGSIPGQWRLPTMHELERLGTDPPQTWSTGYPSTWTIPAAPFTNVQSYPYWSGGWDAGHAVYLDMNSGYVYGESKAFKHYIWPVRVYITLIELEDFTAYPNNNKITLKWSTASEVDNAGFNLYRSETEAGEYAKINTSLIPAKGSSTQGTSYEFVDTNVQNRKTYYYNLEDIDLNGKSTMHGPVSATPRLIYGIGK